MPDLRRRMSEGGLNTKRRLRARMSNLIKEALTIPPHAQFGSPSLLSTPDLPSTGITHTTSLSPGLKVPSPYYATRSSISVDSSLTPMSRSHNQNATATGLPASLFSADAYYFAPNTNPASSSRKKRPSTSTTHSASSVTSDSASNSTPTTHARAPSAAKASASSFTRGTSASTGNDPLKALPSPPLSPPPKPKKRPATPGTAQAFAPASPPILLIDLATHSATTTPPVHSETAPEISEDHAAGRKDTMGYRNPFTLKMDKRHHAYPSTRAPYPRSYDTAAIDHDTSTHIFFKTLCNSLTWHEFPTPPANVLDLGCGNGVWILDSAKEWPNSHFVGLDLVPLQPNLKLVAPHLENRIEWVTANFLEKLDFPDDHFDYVHIRRIARGVPENKWPLLLEEVSRILKPDGAIEVVEEDLIFPGGQEPCTCHYPPDKLESASQEVDQAQRASQDQLTHDEIRHSPPDTPVPVLNSDDAYSHPSHYYSSPQFNLRDHSRLEQAYNDMHSAKFINLMPISVLTSILAQYFKDVRSHPPLLITFPPPEEDMWSDSSESALSSNEGGVRKGAKVRSRPSTAASTVHSMGSSAVSSSAGGSPTRSQYPLSPLSPGSSTGADDGLFSLSEGIDSSENSSYMTHPPTGGWHTLHVDVKSLVHPKQPFFMIDRCRMPARSFAPPPHGSAGHGPAHLMTRLPNATFQLDLQSLTLHLSQSVTEVLECREAIWDFLVEQRRARVKKGPAASSLISSNASINSTASNNNMVDREEFDHWIAKYEREMRERIGLASALRKRFGWKTKGLSSSENRAGGGKRWTTASRSVNPGFGLKNSNDHGQPMAPLSRSSDTNHSSSDVILHDHDQEHDHHEDYSYSASSSSLLVEENTALGGTSAVNAISGPGSTFRPRTGSAPARVSASSGSGHGHHYGVEDHYSRAHSLDVANAWDALFPKGDNGNGASGVGAGTGRQGQEDEREEEEEELPRLSRCVRVFVAWNNKQQA